MFKQFPQLERIAKIRAFDNIEPSILSDFVYQHPFSSTSNHIEFSSNLREALLSISNIELFKQRLRQFRNEQMSLIIQKQMKSASNTIEVMSECSQLADSCIEITQDWASNFLKERFGVPFGENQNQQKLIIIAMGKLGGHELNISSDVDLIFCYGENGTTQGGKKSWSNQEYFTRLVQLIISILNDVSADGFVFRVDTRLRPFGDSGPLVSNLDVLEQYYLQQGRGWERYSMIKARIITGNPSDRQNLEAIIQPFVYRKYLDFSLLETPRNIKRQIEAELRKRNLENNLKLGIGGIREVEFIVQSIQLIHGGKYPTLQVSSTLEALHAIKELDLLSDKEYRVLYQEYVCLRFWEHCIQGINDKQTQELPKSLLNRERLCYLSKHNTWESFYKNYLQVTQNIHEIFISQFSEPITHQDKNNVTGKLVDLVLIPDDSKENHDLILSLGFIDSNEIIALLQNQKPIILKRLNDSKTANREVIVLLLSYLLEYCGKYKDSAKLFKNMVGLIESLTSRPVYIRFFVENKKTLTILCDLFSRSEWIAQYVRKYPLVIDDLLNPEWLQRDNNDKKNRYFMEQIANIPVDDEEQMLFQLREFRHSIMFQTASRFVTQSIDSLQLGWLLSDTAEILINQCYQLATVMMNQKNGTITNHNGLPVEFAIIAFGKLGSKEFGFSSDVDLVFIYDEIEAFSNGNKKLDAGQYFVKLAQKIIHYLTLRMPNGQLYDIDTRLRPSGNSGLLVTSLQSFANYQRDEAWTWEHQALIRSRIIVGSAEIKTQYRQIKSQILSKSLEDKKTLHDVQQMRIKMRETWNEKSKGKTYLKQMPGGIIDIEFLVQYLVLRHSFQYKELTQETNTVNLINLLSKYDILDQHEAKSLISAYLFLINQVNKLALNYGAVLQELESLIKKENVSILQKYGILDLDLSDPI